MKSLIPIIIILVCTFHVTDLTGQKPARPDLFNHAGVAPDSVEQSFSKLANYLISPAQNEAEAAESIFYWLAINIKYNEDLNYASSSTDSIAFYTLLHKESGCEGTACLFYKLCEASQIECAVIYGFAEGYQFDGKKAGKANHGWNAVKINNEWKLVDATWGSGGSTTEGENMIYIQELDMRYFFPDPKDFIIDHFPENPEWQLLDDRISKKEFYSEEYELKRWAKLGW